MVILSPRASGFAELGLEGCDPRDRAAELGREGRDGREGLHFDAAVLGQLHSSKRMEAWEKRTKTGEMRDMAKPQGVDLFSML